MTYLKKLLIYMYKYKFYSSVIAVYIFYMTFWKLIQYISVSLNKCCPAFKVNLRMGNCDVTYSLLYTTPSLPHTCLTVVGHPMNSLLSQNSCWLGSRVVGLAVVMVWWQKDTLSILRLPSVHLALANSQL